jgi:S1-C subfamily serine protease
MSELVKVSEELAAVVQRTAASVVGVEAGRRSRGTGVVWSAEGLIVTADHVLHHEQGIRLRLPGGDRAEAVLVGRDPTMDLAVLRADGRALHPADWAEPDGLAVGHLVFALGRPGQTVRATMGIVSVLGEGWRTSVGARVDRYLEAAVILQPGFSGGPLVDARGAVLGINTGGLRHGGSLTIVTPTVRRVVEALKTHGRIPRGYLGIATQPARLPSRAADAAPQRGLLVIDVEPGSPADAGGVLLGDMLLEAAGQPVRHAEDLLGALTAERIGTVLPLKLMRAGEVRDVAVTVGERLRRTA